MSGKILARATALTLALFLAACGGDDSSGSLVGGSEGGNGGAEGGNGGGDPANETPAVDVGSVQLLASPTQINTSPGSTSALQARVKDRNGILLEDVAVQFSVNNNGTLQVDDPNTDASGTATAILSADDNPGNRTLTVEAVANGVSDSVDILVSGTTISITGPGSVALNETASYRVTLTDGSGRGIGSQTVTASTNNPNNVLTSQRMETIDGVIDFNLTANESGNDVLTVSAFSDESRVTASQPISISPDSFSFIAPGQDNAETPLNDTRTVTLEWLTDGTPVADGTTVRFTSTRGTLAPANNGTAEAGRVESTTVNGRVSVNISSEIPGPSTITATDIGSELSTRRTIEFVATDPAKVDLQTTKAQIDFSETTEILAVVRDADNNLIKNEFVTFQIVSDVSNGTLSQSEGITDSLGRVSTTYTGGASNTGRDGVEIQASVAGATSGSVFLTVARRALRLVLGTGNELEEPDPTSYRKPYVAIVTDSNGAPVEGAQVELSILPVAFTKGRYVETNVGAGEPVWRRDPSVTCPSEDINQNGILDPGEDNNKNGSLTPTNPATTSTNSVRTSADGSVTFDLLYPQSVCGWTRTRLTGTVRVEGTESVEVSEFDLSCLAEDLDDVKVDPPGGVVSRYGLGDEDAGNNVCTNTL
jgi:hypothetical protein